MHPMGVYGTIKRSETAAPSEKLSPLATALLYVTLLLICALAFSIRLVSVVRYESIIHEFDPYFNFRATKYLAHEGFLEFLNWVDDRSWCANDLIAFSDIVNIVYTCTRQVSAGACRGWDGLPRPHGNRGDVLLGGHGSGNPD